MSRCSTCFLWVAHGHDCSSCAVAVAPEPEAVCGAPHVPGYDVGEALGSGGFATVWSATRREDGVRVALKIVARPSALEKRRLKLEAEALRRVGAPFTPAVFGTGDLPDGGSYIAMEPARGKTLADLLQADLARKDCADVCEAILSALEAAHRAGVVHRDLKPENIFVDLDLKQAQLIDFGLATQGENRESLTRTGVIVGSVETMAPEQITGDPIGTWTDVYAFGVILFELMTGRTPFVGDVATIERGHCALRPPRAGQFRETPHGVEDLIARCLAKNKDERPVTVARLRQELRRAWQTSPSTKKTTSKTKLLGGAREPGVVLAVDADDMGFVDATVRFHGGFVARRHGLRSLCVFAGARLVDPIAAAYDAATELLDGVAERAILHLASLSIRQRRRGPPNVAGDAIEAINTWLPATQWTGLLATRSLASATTMATRISTEFPEFSRFEATFELEKEASLHGQALLLQRAETLLRACLAQSSRGVTTVVGTSGSGKSRVARELATLCASVAQSTCVKEVRGGTAAADSEVMAALEAANPCRALVIDDVHRLNAETLDAIEFATLDRYETPLWVAVVGDDSFNRMRPQWGLRAQQHQSLLLEPLTESVAMELAAELLLPADFPPSAFLRRLATWSRGNPAALVGVVTQLRRQGIVRQRKHGDGWYVATGDFEQLPSEPVEQWIANRDLSSMTPDLAACARVCAVLGERFVAAELRGVLDMAEETGVATTQMDAGIGLTRLVERGVLVSETENEYGFRSTGYQRAVYQALGSEDRRGLHSIALRWWTEQAETRTESETSPRLAFHASRSGSLEVASKAHVAVGVLSMANHQHVEADHQFSAALRFAQNKSQSLLAYLGRARARRQLHRTSEALADARAGQALALGLNDQHRFVELVLIEATVADSAGDATLASECAAKARDGVEGQGGPALMARVALAEGRAKWRRGDPGGALPLLQEATVAGHDDTKIQAMLLMAPALVATQELELAEEVFTTVIALCRLVGDRLHECAAYSNRIYLWSAREELDLAVDDLQRSIDLARELGNPEPERVATHNLAELLYWSGDLERALPLAQRGRVLQQRFWKQTPHDALLLARVHAARGESEAASALLAWIADECIADRFDTTTELLALALRLFLDSDSQQWDSLVERVRADLPAEEWFEIMWWRLLLAQRADDAEQTRTLLTRMEERLAEAPIWRPRIRAVQSRSKWVA